MDQNKNQFGVIVQMLEKYRKYEKATSIMFERYWRNCFVNLIRDVFTNGRLRHTLQILLDDVIFFQILFLTFFYNGIFYSCISLYKSINVMFLENKALSFLYNFVSTVFYLSTLDISLIWLAFVIFFLERG